jgi:nucleolar MIF4G domain-containing protein 1
MRRPRPKHNTTSLPRTLRAELGIKDHYGEKKHKRSGPAARKDRRQADRTEKRRGPPPKSKARQYEGGDDDDDDEDLADFGNVSDLDSDLDEDVPPPKSKSAKSESKPKSILKKNQKGVEESESEDAADTSSVKPSKVSQAVKDKLDEDAAEIAALEKKLGLKKGKKLPKSFEEDGLLDLLGDLDDGSADESRKRKREADEWLRNKRRKAQGLAGEDGSEEDDSELGSDEELEDFDDDEDDFGDLDDDEEEDEAEEKPAAKKRENPYVAPVAPSAENKPSKYIPPSLRGTSSSESESLTRLRRQAQGHLNKLSEANLISILGEFEKLYREYPRQNVTSTLLALLFGLVCEGSALQDTFIILHAGFIAALYKVIGPDFGAELVQKLVETFDAAGDERGKFQGKEMINLISLLSQLYNFHVVGSTLVFDYIRLFLQEINEESTELLLKIIRSTLSYIP